MKQTHCTPAFILTLLLAALTLNPAIADDNGRPKGGDGSSNLRTAPGLTVERILEVVGPNTPYVQLHQDNTGGWGEQVWDVAGNEGNFFIRDRTAGTLPLRIRPGAPQNSIYVNNNGRVALGVSNPELSNLEAQLVVNGDASVRGTISSTTTDELRTDLDAAKEKITRLEALVDSLLA